MAFPCTRVQAVVSGARKLVLLSKDKSSHDLFELSLLDDLGSFHSGATAEGGFFLLRKLLSAPADRTCCVNSCFHSCLEQTPPKCDGWLRGRGVFNFIRSCCSRLDMWCAVSHGLKEKKSPGPFYLVIPLQETGPEVTV